MGVWIMPVFLVIRKSDNVVENAIKWDGEAEYDPGQEYDLVQVSGEPDCPWIGWTRKPDGSFDPPVTPPLKRFVAVGISDRTVREVRERESSATMFQEVESPGVVWVLCDDESVQPGWTISESGEFVAPE